MKDYIEVQLMKKIQDLMIDIYRTTQRVNSYQHIISKVRKSIKKVSEQVTLSYQLFLEEERIDCYEQALFNLENISFYTRMLSEHEKIAKKDLNRIKNQADFVGGFLTGLSVAEKRKLNNRKVLKLKLGKI